MFIKRFRSSLIPVDNRYPRIPLFPNSMESLVFAQKSSEYNGFLLTHWPLGNALKNENKTYQNYFHFLKRVWWFSYETGAGGLPRFLINIGWRYDWVPSGNKPGPTLTNMTSLGPNELRYKPELYKTHKKVCFNAIDEMQLVVIESVHDVIFKGLSPTWRALLWQCTRACADL